MPLSYSNILPKPKVNQLRPGFSLSGGFSPRQNALSQVANPQPASNFMSVMPKTKPTTPARDYSSFSDSDWTNYQANKPKPPGSQGMSQSSANSSGDNSGLYPTMGSSNTQSPPQSVTQQNDPQTTPPVAGGLFGQYTRRLAENSSRPGDAYNKAQDIVTQRQKELEALRENEADTVSGELGRKGIPLNIGQGRAALAQNQYLAKENAKSNELAQAQGQVTAANTQQGLQQAGLTSAIGASAPQQYGLTTQPYNPVEDTYGGGAAGGAINRAVQASNIGSAQDFQSKIQNIEATRNAMDSNFGVLNDYATKSSTDINSPIIEGIRRKFGTTIEGNQAVAGFQAQLQNVRAAYQSITGADPAQAIPDNITPAQLKQVRLALRTTIQNNLVNYRNQLNYLKGGANNGSTGGGGKMFGTFFD